MKLTHLYLIVFPQKSIFKIGKANDIHNRIHSLKAYWGDPDLDQSYYVVADENLVFRIELALKNILLGYKYECDDGDGKTEIFDIEALDIALKHLDIFLQSPVAEKLVIQKGIKQKFTNTKTQVKRKTLSAIRKNKKFRESFQNASEKI